MLKANFHTHTTFCDGRASAEEMAERALALGFEQLGFSGHMDPDIHMDWPAYAAEVRRLREKYRGRLDILLGAELDTLYDPDSCPGAEYRIGSTHFIDIPGASGVSSVDTSPADSQRTCDEWFGGDWYRMAAAYYETEARVVERTRCTFVGHFDLITRFNEEMRAFDEDDPRYRDAALGCMRHLARSGVPFEINTGARARAGKRAFYPAMPLLRALRDLGGEIVISSDAHFPEHLDCCFAEAARCAEACGFTHTNLLVHDGAGRVVFRSYPLDLC